MRRLPLLLCPCLAAIAVTSPPVRKVVVTPIPVIPLWELSPSAPHLGAPAVPPAVDSDVHDLNVALSGGQPALQTQILRALNAVRASHRLAPLRSSRPLQRAALAHVRALAIAGAFEHEWPDGRPFQRWILRYYPAGGYGYWSAGENLLWTAGDLTANQAVAMWMASPEHRRNILTPSWREVGIGVVHADGAGGAYLGYGVELAATEFGARASG